MLRKNFSVNRLGENHNSNMNPVKNDFFRQKAQNILQDNIQIPQYKQSGKYSANLRSKRDLTQIPQNQNETRDFLLMDIKFKNQQNNTLIDNNNITFQNMQNFCIEPYDTQDSKKALNNRFCQKKQVDYPQSASKLKQTFSESQLLQINTKLNDTQSQNKMLKVMRSHKKNTRIWSGNNDDVLQSTSINTSTAIQSSEGGPSRISSAKESMQQFQNKFGNLQIDQKFIMNLIEENQKLKQQVTMNGEIITQLYEKFKEKNEEEICLPQIKGIKENSQEQQPQLKKTRSEMFNNIFGTDIAKPKQQRFKLASKIQSSQDTDEFSGSKEPSFNDLQNINCHGKLNQKFLVSSNESNYQCILKQNVINSEKYKLKIHGLQEQLDVNQDDKDIFSKNNNKQRQLSRGNNRMIILQSDQKKTFNKIQNRQILQPNVQNQLQIEQFKQLNNLNDHDIINQIQQNTQLQQQQQKQQLQQQQKQQQKYQILLQQQLQVTNDKTNIQHDQYLPIQQYQLQQQQQQILDYQQIKQDSNKQQDFVQQNRQISDQEQSKRKKFPKDIFDSNIKLKRRKE